MTEPYIEPTECADCKFEREEYGGYRCAAHYNFDEDNARAIEQTGHGIIGSLTEEEIRIWKASAGGSSSTADHQDTRN